MALLPNAGLAIIPEEKLSGYCLNEEHQTGKYKAYLFRTLLNFTAQDSDLLRAKIQEAILITEAQIAHSDQYGERYTVDFLATNQERSVTIRTSCIILRNDAFPRLTSCYIL